MGRWAQARRRTTAQTESPAGALLPAPELGAYVAHFWTGNAGGTWYWQIEQDLPENQQYIVEYSTFAGPAGEEDWWLELNSEVGTKAIVVADAPAVPMYWRMSVWTISEFPERLTEYSEWYTTAEPE